MHQDPNISSAGVAVLEGGQDGAHIARGLGSKSSYHEYPYHEYYCAHIAHGLGSAGHERVVLAQQAALPRTT